MNKYFGASFSRNLLAVYFYGKVEVDLKAVVLQKRIGACCVRRKEGRWKRGTFYRTLGAITLERAYGAEVYLGHIWTQEPHLDSSQI